MQKKIINKKFHSRRYFLKGIIGVGVIANLPLINSCNPEKNRGILTKRQKEIAKYTFGYLWPDDKSGPGIVEIKVYDYLIWMLSDKNIDPEENQYTINGLNWVDETAMEDYQKHFEKICKREKYRLLHKISNLEWGENWLSKMLSILIEALFADPVYGSNPDGIGWKWVNHNPGQPRPDNENKYPVILNRKKENIFINSLEEL